MQSYIGQGGKNPVLSSAAKKWKDFKEKLEYNHRLSRKGYAGLEDQLEETMLGVEIDRSTLWKKARQDKDGNIPDPKVAEKAKLIDELQKQVSEGSVSVSGSNDVYILITLPFLFVFQISDGIEVVDYSKVEVSSSLQSLCRYVETTLTPQEKIMTFTIEKEVFGADRNTFVLPEDITQLVGMEEIEATVLAVYLFHTQICVEKKNHYSIRRRCLYDHLKEANMFNMVGFIDPAQVSANAGRNWVLPIVRAKKETVYFLDPLPRNRVVDEEAKNMVNSAIKIYNSHIGRQGRKAPIWKTLPGTPKQPSSVECRYYVMRFMGDIIMDPSLEFEKTFAKGKEQAPYPQAAIDEVRNEWAELVCLKIE
ncbi:unnamed protein product [Prunus brigantina]